MLMCIRVCEVCVLLCDIRREEKRKGRREGTHERQREEGRELCHIVTKCPNFHENIYGVFYNKASQLVII